MQLQRLFAAGLLRDPVRREGLAIGGRGHRWAAEVLARHELPEDCVVFGRARGVIGADATTRVRQSDSLAFLQDFAMLDVPTLPGCGARLIPMEQRNSGRADYREQVRDERPVVAYEAR